MNLSTWIPERGPVRAFALVNLLNTVGSGLYLAGGALFFTRGLALPPQTVAWGLGAGFAVGLVVSLAIGRLADRIEPYVVYTTLLVVQALAMSAYPFVSSVVGFVAVALVSGTADRGIAATVGAVIHRLSGEHSRTLVRAQLRTTTNVGIALGSLLAGIALAADTRLGYSLLIWGNAASFAIAAMLGRVWGIGRTTTSQSGTGSADGGARPGATSLRSPWRDARYLIVTVASGVIALQGPLLTFCLPLWVATRTDAPLWCVSVVLVVNTVLVVVLQAPISAMARDFPGARRTARLGGVALAGSCLLLPLTSSSAAVAVLLVWILVLTAGELTSSTAQFFVAFELAPDDAQGRYQSVYALGQGAARAVGPGLLSALVLGGGAAGCVLLAVVLLAAGLVLAACTQPAAWGGRTLSMEQTA